MREWRAWWLAKWKREAAFVRQNPSTRLGEWFDNPEIPNSKKISNPESRNLKGSDMTACGGKSQIPKSQIPKARLRRVSRLGSLRYGGGARLRVCFGILLFGI